MAIAYTPKSHYGVDDLLEIMGLLRSPEGCPWDREQTHASIRNNLLEEAYEAADAIDKADTENLREELGDVLLQVVMHADMAKDAGHFDFHDVVHEVCHKLVERHPHVFGTVHAETGAQALSSWEAVKRQTKQQQTFTATLQSVPTAFPALMRAQKVQKRAAKAGFDWPDINGPLEKVGEELKELSEARTQHNQAHIQEEFGDVLFALVNVARFLGLDSEQALAAATDKFTRRFEKVEELANARGIDMPSTSLEELDKLWDEAKQM